MKKLIFVVVAVVALALALASCGNKKAPVADEQKVDSTAVQVEVVDTTVVK